MANVIKKKQMSKEFFIMLSKAGLIYFISFVPRIFLLLLIKLLLHTALTVHPIEILYLISTSIILLMGSLMGQVSWGMAFTAEFGLLELLIQKVHDNFLQLFNKKLANRKKIHLPPSCYFLRISAFLYSQKTQQEVFDPIVGDWQEEYFESLLKKEIWKARWLNIRYIYLFLAAMWGKSPIGDLIEFIKKIAI